MTRIACEPLLEILLLLVVVLSWVTTVNMAQSRISFNINVRAKIWLEFLGYQQKMILPKYIEQVLLRHLEQTPGVDLSQSPYSQPKGVSNGKQDERDNGRNDS